MEKLYKKYERTPVIADIQCLKKIKIALDDMLVMYLRHGLSLAQDNIITDLRIVIGVISIACAIFITYLSMNFEFAEYKVYSMILLGIYYTLNGFIGMVMKYIANGCIFKSKNTDLKAYTNLIAPDTNYVVMIYRNGVIPEKYNKNICDLFNEDGVLLHDVFFKDLQLFLKDEKVKRK